MRLFNWPSALQYEFPLGVLRNVDTSLRYELEVDRERGHHEAKRLHAIAIRVFYRTSRNADS